MASTPKTITTVKKTAPESEALPEEAYSQRKRATEARFRVQVDRRTKSSHTTLAAAETAAKAIKNAYSVVQVSIHDAEESKTTLIEETAQK